MAPPARPAAGVQGSGSPRGRTQSHAPALALRSVGDLEKSAGPAQPNVRPRDPTLTCTSPASQPSQSRLLHPGDAHFLSVRILLLKRLIYLIYVCEYTVAVFRYIRRGHLIPLQMVVSHHVVAAN